MITLLLSYTYLLLFGWTLSGFIFWAWLELTGPDMPGPGRWEALRVFLALGPLMWVFLLVSFIVALWHDRGKAMTREEWNDFIDQHPPWA